VDASETGRPAAPGLAGTVALVAGAGGGIGGAIARALAAAGAETWLLGRSRAALEETAQACAGRAHVRPADLTAPDEVRALAAEVGRVDVLVYAAGVAAHGAIVEAPVVQLEEQLDVNVVAFARLVQALLPALRESRGQIVVTNSSAATGPRPGAGYYAASKQALRALVDALRGEVNADGVRVLAVFPGRTATSLQARLYEAEGREYRPELLLQPEDLATMVVAALSLPRTAEVTELHIRPALKSY
jgi:NADP-dependent 3-hydroxy acid dehydrogenase YdfG